jgi:hypothetical protein
MTKKIPRTGAKQILEEREKPIGWTKAKQIAWMADPAVRRTMFRKAIAELEERRSKKLGHGS